MFHVSDNLFFGRLDNGDVRILKFKRPPTVWPDVNRVYISADVEFDEKVPAGSWPSVVASVSNAGEGDGRFYTAQAFHMNPRPTIPPKPESNVFGAQF